MRTKNIFNLFLALTFISSAKAQFFSGGIVGGVSTSAAKIEDIGNKFTNVINGTDIHGYEGGIFAKLQIRPFYVKVMALYNFNSGNVSYQSDDNGVVTNHTDNFTFQKFEVPALLGLKIIGPLSIEAGPVYNYVIQSTGTFDANNVTIQRSGIGYRAGVMLEIGWFLLGVSYEGVTYNSSGIDKATFKEPYKLVFGLGIKLGGSGGEKQKS